MKAHIAKWGNSLGVRLPKSAAFALGVEPGSSIEIEVQADHVLLRRSEPTVDELVAAITPDNVHGETFTAEAQGDEVW